MTALEDRLNAIAGDGRLENYKSTKLYDAAVGREQHGFPSREGATSMTAALALA